MEWKHIRDLYSKLRTMATHLMGLSLVSKSKDERINLTSCSKMRVDLAAEIVGVEVQFNDNLSHSVGYHSYIPYKVVYTT